MRTQMRTWGSRYDALQQESTPPSPELRPCATPSPVVSPLGLVPTTSARDRAITAPEATAMGAYNDSKGDASSQGHMRTASYNGSQYNNQSQHASLYGYRVRHEASVFVAGYVIIAGAYTYP